MKFKRTDINFNSHYFFKNQVTIRAQIQETQRRVEQERREQEEVRQRYEELEVMVLIHKSICKHPFPLGD